MNRPLITLIIIIIIAEKLAKRLKIKGIFDIEVINHKGKLKLLEIDARFPSQTPISVYHSSGINMVAMLVELSLDRFNGMKKTKKQVSFYQQIVVDESSIKVLGEHVIETSKNLTLVEKFFGADEAITDYKKGNKKWKAIIICTSDNYENAYNKFLLCIDKIKNKYKNENLIFIEG